MRANYLDVGYNQIDYLDVGYNQIEACESGTLASQYNNYWGAIQ